MRFATISMAILHRYMLVPMPAVAVMPVSLRTVLTRRMVNSLALRP